MNSNTVNIHKEGFTFPGTLRQYVWQFPTIEVKTRNAKNTLWTIYAGVIESNINPNIFKQHMNRLINGKPNKDYNEEFTFANICTKINPDWLHHYPITASGKEFYGFTVAELHYEGSPEAYDKATVIKQGKNLGKRNATNVFTQALSEAFSKYRKKVQTAENQANEYVLPMLASGEAVSSEANAIEQKVSELLLDHGSLYVQYKYDGIRCMATIDAAAKPEWKYDVKTSDGIVQLAVYSRTGNKLNITETMQVEMVLLLNALKERYHTFDYESFILDGEIYCHGMHLNEISGYVRGDATSKNRDKLKFYLFDIYYKSDEFLSADKNDITRYSEPFTSRLHVTESIRDVIINTDTIEWVQTELLSTTQSIVDMFHKALAADYEGLILRLKGGKYEPGINGYHSSRMIKLKPFMRAEYPCIDFKEGKGASEGLIIFICKLTKEQINVAINWLTKYGFNPKLDANISKTFAVVPKATEAERRQMYIEMSEVMQNGKTRFENEFESKPYTIEFQSYSEKNFTPERLQGIGFRLD